MICKNCQQNFEITDADRQFYNKINVPEPTFCPDCRLQLRLYHTNIINLHVRKCDLTGKQIISMYGPEVPFPVYESREWHTDKWDPLKYGRDFDFSRPFFSQYLELKNVAPHPSANVKQESLVNSDYINCATYSKNCYLIFDSDYDEDCYYGFSIQNSKDVMDGMRVRQSEISYNCVDCFNLYNSKYCQNCRNCVDSYFLFQCSNCQSCFGCVNLATSQYCWFNEQLSKEEYEVKLAAVDLGSRQIVDEFYKEFKEHKKKFPKAAYQGFKNLNCIGDHLYNCKNSLDCFDCYGLEDCRYCVAVFLPLKDSYDCFECGLNASLLYQSIHGFESYNTKFTCYGGGAENVEYCHHPHSNCKNCFGCVGLRKKQYCIFNKQYGEEEYFKLKEKIVAHMKETGEYGQFFPPEISPWGYNETMAGLYFPLSKDEAMKQGFKWNDQEGEYKSSAYRIPDNIKDVSDDILQATLADRETGRNYRIIKQELDYYRQHNIPVPVNAFVERHKRRLALRNPKKLWQRQCAKCGQQMMTAYSPESEEVVYCKECFTKEVY